MTLAVTVVPVTPYQQNCSVVKCETTGKAAIVDPGGDIDRILAAVEKMSATVETTKRTRRISKCSSSMCALWYLILLNREQRHDRQEGCARDLC